MSDADAIEREILRAIDADGVVNTARAAERLDVDPQATVGTMKRLSAANMVVATALDRSQFTLTAEGEAVELETSTRGGPALHEDGPASLFVLCVASPSR